MNSGESLFATEQQSHEEQLSLARQLNAIYLRFVYAGHIRTSFTFRELFFSVSLCLCGESFVSSFAGAEKSCC
jgi:hypothetical protein